MSLPVEHYIKIWSARRNAADSKELTPTKVTEIEQLLLALQKLAPGTLLEIIRKGQTIQFVRASSHYAPIASLSYEEE